ncbi:MAG: 2-oxoacid:acceptor oxidoreductase family protein [Betaproteobacteria bacterium]|jgi:pyruvate ferredoxin oxidoreductase gamma subunit|nr:MAG: 2-oxoacid:acceptor oxidoreductase family protein [Betaproteobacteria bacterium]
MFRVRFHGRGGQGMKAASRILGNAFFLEGYEVQDAPRYGAERRGAPIFAYVRAGREPINERGIIRHPDLVIVADDSLIPVPGAGVMSGVDSRTVVLINSEESPKVWKQRLNFEGDVFTVPVETADRAELRFIGVTCVGAAARLLGAIKRETLSEAIRQELASLGSDIVQISLSKALAAFDSMQAQAGTVTPVKTASSAHFQPPDWIDLSLEDARASAPAIHAGATSIEVRTGLWRTLRPVIDHDRCNRCWWVCSTFCPDGAINVDTEGRPQIDYDHCKGCMICVAQCPPHAIRAISEREAQAAEVEEASK